MQNMNDNNTSQQSKGENILFYGEFASISPDIHMKGGAIDSSKLLSAVQAHKDDAYLTVMDTDYISLSIELKQEVAEINPNTQFIQVSNLGEFTEYYDRGMDRELHPVENVTSIESVMFYDTIEKEQPEVKKEIDKPREYIKATDISSSEMLKDLNSDLKKMIDLKPQEFLDFMGLKDDVNSTGTESMIGLAKMNLSKEFFRDYSLPQAGKTAVESIEKVIPSMPAKSMKEAIQEGAEFVYDMVGDTDRGHLVIDYDCTSLSDCHIKGVYREYEDTKEAISEKVDETTKDKIEVDESGRVIYDHESNITVEANQLEQTNTYDPTTKAQEIVDSLDLPEYDSSMDNNNSIDY